MTTTYRVTVLRHGAPWGQVKVTAETPEAAQAEALTIARDGAARVAAKVAATGGPAWAADPEPEAFTAGNVRRAARR